MLQRVSAHVDVDQGGDDSETAQAEPQADIFGRIRGENGDDVSFPVAHVFESVGDFTRKFVHL